jgi:hypothetical protein
MIQEQIENALKALLNANEQEIAEIYLGNFELFGSFPGFEDFINKNLELKKIMLIRNVLNERYVKLFNLDGSNYELVNRVTVKNATKDVITLSDAIHKNAQT